MPAESPPYRDASQPLEQRVSDLLTRMALEEKVDQLHQGSVGDTNPNNIQARAGEFRPTFGSFIIGGPRGVLEMRNALQERAVQGSRLGIPVLFAADVIHGYRVILPIPLAQACSWDPGLVQEGCALTAAVTRAHGIDWTFAPMVDHCVDARWGRIAETFGESPYASGVYCAASVRGYQGDRLDSPRSVAACLKHYVGYGASEGGRDYSFTEVSPQMLWERHLPAFEAGIRAGACTVMSAFNDLNGIPTSANRHTLTEILRNRLGFTGPVVSDWNSVLQLLRQGFAADEAEAVVKAITAGVDIDMADTLYVRHLATLARSGAVSMATIDEAVRRVLRLKFALGLFEQPFTERSELTDAEPTDTQLALAEELAARSMVLLKNDDALPLAAGAGRIAVIGPLAQATGALLGPWAQQGRPDETATIFDALVERLPAGTSARHAEGCAITGLGFEGRDAAVALAHDSDVVILCLGEERWMSGENAARSTLRLDGRQEDLVHAVASTGKPIVLVIVSGRPVELHAIESKVRAIVAAWQGGTCAAAALADILLGWRNPSGRLAVTWPRTTGQIPIHHGMRPRARAGDEGAYQDIPTTPLYDFAHGLGYTAFAYSNIRLERDSVGRSGSLMAEVSVTNTGDREGRETVFWFIRDPAASITRPLRELKYFEQASIPAGGSRVFRFEIEPRRDLSFPDAESNRILDTGEIILSAGNQDARFVVTP